MPKPERAVVYHRHRLGRKGPVRSGGLRIRRRRRHQWIRDELRFISEARDAEYYASKVPDTGGVYLVPAFTGLGAPHWDMYARGALWD